MAKQTFANQTKTPLTDFFNAKKAGEAVVKLREILASTKTSSIRKRKGALSKAGMINDTGRLSKSYKINVKRMKGEVSVEFTSSFYGRYVRAYYKKKRNIDIWEPLSQKAIIDAMKKITLDMKDQIIQDIKDVFKAFSKV